MTKKQLREHLIAYVWKQQYIHGRFDQLEFRKEPKGLGLQNIKKKETEPSAGSISSCTPELQLQVESPRQVPTAGLDEATCGGIRQTGPKRPFPWSLDRQEQQGRRLQ